MYNYMTRNNSILSDLKADLDNIGPDEISLFREFIVVNCLILKLKFLWLQALRVDKIVLLPVKCTAWYRHFCIHEYIDYL